MPSTDDRASIVDSLYGSAALQSATSKQMYCFKPGQPSIPTPSAPPPCLRIIVGRSSSVADTEFLKERGIRQCTTQPSEPGVVISEKNSEANRGDTGRRRSLNLPL